MTAKFHQRANRVTICLSMTFVLAAGCAAETSTSSGKGVPRVSTTDGSLSDLANERNPPAGWADTYSIWQLHGKPLIEVHEENPARSLEDLGSRATIITEARLVSVSRARDYGGTGPGAIPVDLFTFQATNAPGQRYAFELTRADSLYDVPIEEIRKTLPPEDETYILFLIPRNARTAPFQCAVSNGCIVRVDRSEGADSVLYPNYVSNLGGSSFKSIESFLKAVGGPKS